jgi:hypothetical protein
MAPSPSNVAYIGMIKAKKGEFEDPIKLVPLYIRKSEAEIKAEDRQQTNRLSESLCSESLL